MAKLCPKCGRTLPNNHFNWKIKNIKLASHCKECSRKYIRRHYENNKKYYLEKARKRNWEIRITAHKYLGPYLSSHPCVDCGEKDILVLEFDHKDKKRKIGEISRIIMNGGNLERVAKEVSKCEVRCANCHRRKTSKENNSWKLKYAPVA